MTTASGLLVSGRAPSASFGELVRRAASAAPKLLFGLRLWAAVCLALYVAFWFALDNAYWAGTTAAIVSQPNLGASLRKGAARMAGTVLGAVAIVALTACFPQQRAAFLVSLALWGAVCGFTATILRNSAAYGAVLAGVTAVIIAGDELGAVGGASGDAFMLAVTRASEICIGIVSASIVLAGTDIGRARLKMSRHLGALCAAIGKGLFNSFMLQEPAAARANTREVMRQIIALDPVFDGMIGEEPDLRYRAHRVQAAVAGLSAALCGWRAIIDRLASSSDRQQSLDASAVLRNLPQEFRALPDDWLVEGPLDPVRLRSDCFAAARRLSRLPAKAPSLRLLADRAAKALTGIARGLEGLALLAERDCGGSAMPPAPMRVPDLLPAIVNAARVFIAIGSVALFWIATAWPNGALAMTWAAIFVISLVPSAERGFADSKDRLIAVSLAAILAAIVKFALLPGNEGFVALALALGLVLVPAGTLSGSSWHASIFATIVAWFVPLVAPANQIAYDPQQYYNSALAIVSGAGIGTLAFGLLSPTPASHRARRLLAFTVREVGELAAGRVSLRESEWEGRIYHRLAGLPRIGEVRFQQFVAALTMGTAVIRLRRFVERSPKKLDIDRAIFSLAQSDSNNAIEIFKKVDHELEASGATGSTSVDALRARAEIVAITDALARHGPVFDELARP